MIVKAHVMPIEDCKLAIVTKLVKGDAVSLEL